MAREAVVVNGIVFKSKTHAIDYAKGILHKYKPDEEITGKDLTFMREYIKGHYYATYLVPWLAEGKLTVEFDPYGTTCFSIIKKEGDRQRFSYRKFMTPDTKLKLFKMCARRAVHDDIVALSVASGTIGKKTHHVDHAGEWTFDRICVSFIEETKLDVEKIKFVECNFGTALPFSIAESFRHYHNERAELKVLCIEDHKVKHKKKN